MNDNTQIAVTPEVTEKSADRMVFNLINVDKAQNALLYAKWAIEKGVAPKSVKTKEEYFMLMQAGTDLGMTLTEIHNSLAFIQGRVTMWGSEVMARMTRSGYSLSWEKADREGVILTVSNGQQSHTETYTWKDAEIAGLTHGMTWGKYPVDMMRYKCVARAVRFFCPHVIGGYGIKEDMEEPASPAEKPAHTGPDLSQFQMIQPDSIS